MKLNRNPYDPTSLPGASGKSFACKAFATSPDWLIKLSVCLLALLSGIAIKVAPLVLSTSIVDRKLGKWVLLVLLPFLGIGCLLLIALSLGRRRAIVTNIWCVAGVTFAISAIVLILKYLFATARDWGW